MHHKQGKTVRVHELVGRPCVGVATFPIKEWTRVTSNGRPATDVRPSETKWHRQWYPAFGDAPAAVFDTNLGYGWVPLDLPESDWPVMEHVNRAKSACAAE